MPNLNRVMLMGNLTRDVELKDAASTSVAKLGLAINRKWKDTSGETKEEVTFVDCEAWGKTAEAMAKYLAKGRPVFIEGRLKFDQWEDKDGGKRSKLCVVVESFTFVGGKDAATQPEAAPKMATPRASAPVEMEMVESNDFPF